MKNKIFILFLIITLCSFFIYAEEEQGINKIVTISRMESCHDLTVKIISKPTNQIDNINMLKCTEQTKHIYNCDCNGRYDLKAITNDDTNGLFSFTLQYYTEIPKTQKQLNMSNSQYDNYLHTLKRTKNINELQIGKVKEKKSIFSFLSNDNTTPNGEGSFIIIVIIIIIIIILLVVIFSAWYFLKDEFKSNDNEKINIINNNNETEDIFNKLQNK